MEICSNCGEEVIEGFYNKNSIYCGDCALQEIVKIHGISEREAECILEKMMFGNGFKW